MRNQVLPLITKRQYDFSSGSATIPVVKAVPVEAWTSGSLLVRVHDATITSGGSVSVTAKTTAPSVDEPEVDFVSGTAAATAAVTASGSPQLVKADLSSGFGGFLRIDVVGVKGTGTTSATISADLVMKG